MNAQTSGPGPLPPVERGFTPQVVDFFQGAAEKRAKEMRKAGEAQVADLRKQIAELERQAKDVEAQTEWNVAELHRAAGEIARRAVPQPTLANYLPEGKRRYPDALEGPELSSNPDAALGKFQAAHDAQDAAEQVQR